MSGPIDLSGRPLRDTRRDRELFVDRAEELESVRQALGRRSNVLLLGQRGSGKTSLLHQVARALREEGERVAVLNGRVASSGAELLSLLREELEALPGLSPQPRPLRTSQLAPGDAAINETRAFQLALASLRASMPDENTHVLVDEMPSAQVAHALFGRLRDELWELPLTWLVAADERDRASYTEPPADAFWRRVVMLGPLARAAAIELLRRRLGDEQLPVRVLEMIADEAAGSPRRLVSLAYEVVVEQKDPEDVVERGRARSEKLATLSEPARRLFAELEAGGPASPSDQGLLKSLGWSRSRASQVFGELEHDGLVRAAERPGNGGRPRRVYDLVEEPDGEP